MECREMVSRGQPAGQLRVALDGTPMHRQVASGKKVETVRLAIAWNGLQAVSMKAVPWPTPW